MSEEQRDGENIRVTEIRVKKTKDGSVVDCKFHNFVDPAVEHEVTLPLDRLEEVSEKVIELRILLAQAIHDAVLNLVEPPQQMPLREDMPEAEVSASRNGEVVDTPGLAE